jgi:hypothetical protein
MKRLLRVEWDAIAGIVAAVAALIMHFLHTLEIDVLLMIFVVLLALLFIRDLRREHFTERIDTSLGRTEAAINVLQANLATPDAILVGPRQLRAATESFSMRARGEMIWFHVCLLMFKPQSLFNTLLRPAIENPMVTSIEFILDVTQQELWRQGKRCGRKWMPVRAKPKCENLIGPPSARTSRSSSRILGHPARQSV